MKLFGAFKHSLDEKNRFKVPASVRSKMGVEAYFIKAPDTSTKCVYMYSQEEWEKFCAQFTEFEEDTEETRRISRKYLSGVVYGEIDKGGRLTLNAGLKEFAGIEDEVYIIGNARHIELWSVAEWEKENEEMEDTSAVGKNIRF